MITKILVTFLTQYSLNLFYLTLQHPLELQETLKHLSITSIVTSHNNIISGPKKLSSLISDQLIQFLIEPLDFSEKCKDAIQILTNSILRLTLLKLIGMIFALLLIQMMHLSIFSKSQTSF